MNTSTAEVNQNAVVDELASKRITFAEFQESHFDYCRPVAVDVSDIYPLLNSLPAGTDESMVLDDFLKKEGFEQIDFGWGNWMDGPRIVMMSLKRDNCRCEIVKRYRIFESREDSIISMLVTEELHCNQPTM